MLTNKLSQSMFVFCLM